MRVFPIFKLLAPILGLTMLCSCNAVALSSTESLLVAPKLNKRQSEVSKALETSLSLRSIVYRYPQGGEYRSPFIFYDFDSDGVDEAIVFYSPADDESGNVRAKILSQSKDGTWTPFYDIPSQSTQVEFVRFEKLIKDSPPCMLIGWQGEGRRTSTLGIYSMKNIAEADLSYLHYDVGDFDNDGLSEVVVVAPSGGSRYIVSLVRDIGGYIGIAGEQPLSEDVQAVRSLVTGRLGYPPYSSVIYVDEALSDGVSPTIATEVFKADASGLSLLVGGEPVASGGTENLARINYELTFRNEDMYCEDFDGDGIVELPYPLAYQSQDFGNYGDLPVIQMMQLLPEGFEVQKTAVLNAESGYLFYYPERWTPDEVNLELDRESGELRFRKYNSNTESAEEELLRIRTSSTKNNPDMFEEYIGYTELYSRGTRLYSAFIPALQPEPLAMSEDEVKESFLPLDS